MTAAGYCLLETRAGIYSETTTSRDTSVPTNKQLYEEMQAKRSVEHREAERDRRRALIRAGFACIAWAAAGLVCYAFAFHTTDMTMVPIYQWGAYLITYGGISYTLLRAYRKGVDRGDW